MIRGAWVALRPAEDGDAQFVHRWMNHPDLWRYMDYERPFSLADAKKDLEQSRLDGQPFTIVVNGRPIGTIGLNRFSRRDRRCSLYMYIGEPDCWGHGYGGEAVTTLLAYAFGRYDLRAVDLWTLADNDRAIHVYQRCGFVEEARLPERSWKEGRWVDHVLMSVTREAFERTRPLTT